MGQGHAGNKYNDLVDKMAVLETKIVFKNFQPRIVRKLLSLSLLLSFLLHFFYKHSDRLDLIPSPFSDLSTSAPIAFVNLRKGSPTIKTLIPTF